MAEHLAVVSWRYPDQVMVKTHADLDALIDEVEAAMKHEGPLALHIVRPDGDCLTLGICDSGRALLLTPSSGEPPCLVSVGDEASGEEISFYDGQEGPYLDSRSLVPLSVARRAAVEFLCGGEPSRDVRWEEVLRSRCAGI